MEDNQTVTQEHIAAVDKLQSLCAEIYLYTIPSLRTGQTETEIAEIIRAQFRKHGIESFWYDVPIFALIGTQRFRDMATSDYPLKSPSAKVSINPGDPVFIDMHPIDKDGYWGDFCAMTVFQPRPEIDDEQVAFLRLTQRLQRDGITAITAGTTAHDLASWYTKRFREENVTLEDPRGNVGHSMHTGEKKYDNGTDKRTFLDTGVTASLAGRIWAIEPGGYNVLESGKMLVGRWEDCVYVSPQGQVTILGRKEPVPILF